MRKELHEALGRRLGPAHDLDAELLPRNPWAARTDCPGRAAHLPASRTLAPLAGVRVVAWEHAVAAPLATRHLADLGADVVKVERPTAAISREPTTRPSTASARTSCGSIAANAASSST